MGEGLAHNLFPDIFVLFLVYPFNSYFYCSWYMYIHVTLTLYCAWYIPLELFIPILYIGIGIPLELFIPILYIGIGTNL